PELCLMVEPLALDDLELLFRNESLFAQAAVDFDVAVRECDARFHDADVALYLTQLLPQGFESFRVGTLLLCEQPLGLPPLLEKRETKLAQTADDLGLRGTQPRAFQLARKREEAFSPSDMRALRNVQAG